MTDSAIVQQRTGAGELNGRIDPKLLLAVAFLQGVALFLLHKVEGIEAWLSTAPIADTVLQTISVVLPVGILLGATTDNLRRFLKGALLFTVLAAILAAYTGYLLTPWVRNSGIMSSFRASGLVLCFQALIYLQLWSARLTITYDRFFLLSWRNLLVASASYLFMGVLWLILLLWGELFELVGIDFFSELFGKDWFIFPALSLAAGLGYVIFRRLSGIIDTFSRVLRALCFFLLPLVSAILLMFLAVLPVTGLGALWEIGSGSGLVLWLVCFYLIFFNAIYRVEEGFTGYPVWLEKLVLIGLAVTPAYAIIALSDIWLQVDQYGLTVDRCWALTISLLLLGLTAMYAVLVVSARLNMPSAIGVTNIRFGWVVMGLMVLVNTPMLDFRKVSLNSQLAAWERGEVSDEDLDVKYIATNLGRHGYLALTELKERGSDELVARIEETYKGWQFHPRTRRLTPDDLMVWHTDDPAPEELVQTIIEAQGRTNELRIHLVPVELDGQAPTEWIVIHEYADRYREYIWRQEKGEWRRGGTYQSYDTDGLEWEEFLQDEANFKVLPPRWKNIKMGNENLAVEEPANAPVRKLTLDDLVVWHTDNPAPEELVQAVIEERGWTADLRIHLVPVELDDQAPTEWLAIHDENDKPENRHVWYWEKGEWRRHALSRSHSDRDWEEFLQDPANIEVVMPRWKTLWVGDRKRRVDED